MKIAFCCPFAHLTIIRKDDNMEGRIPPSIMCTALYCGHPAEVIGTHVMDDVVHATHEFYKDPHEFASIEEINYLKAGGLLFREIPGAIKQEVINEFKNTDEVIKLAEQLVIHYPSYVGKMKPVDAAIDILINNLLYKYKDQHDQILQFLNGKGLDPYDDKDMTIQSDVATAVIGILKSYL